MSASKYLPPFTNDERSSLVDGSTVPHRHVVDPAVVAAAAADPDATYADFLGDEVED